MPTLSLFLTKEYIIAMAVNAIPKSSSPAIYPSPAAISNEPKPIKAVPNIVC